MKKSRITPEKIKELKDNELFVFGSNIAGAHGKGAAKDAYKLFGARPGQALGLQGRSYGIPTVNKEIRAALPIHDIKGYVDYFILFAIKHSKYKFFVTAIGCGLAGYTPDEMAPLWKKAVDVENIILPKSFWKVLEK